MVTIFHSRNAFNLQFLCWTSVAVLAALVNIVFHKVAMLLQQHSGYENLNSSLAGFPQTAAHYLHVCLCVSGIQCQLQLQSQAHLAMELFPQDL